MQDHLILVGMALADAALVLMESDFENPLHTVHDAQSARTASARGGASGANQVGSKTWRL